MPDRPALGCPTHRCRRFCRASGAICWRWWQRPCWWGGTALVANRLLGAARRELAFPYLGPLLAWAGRGHHLPLVAVVALLTLLVVATAVDVAFTEGNGAVIEALNRRSAAGFWGTAAGQSYSKPQDDPALQERIDNPDQRIADDVSLPASGLQDRGTAATRPGPADQLPHQNWSTAAAAASMSLLPQPRHFIDLVERFERNLSRVLAVVLIVVLLAGTVQLVLSTAQALLQPGQNWLDGGLIQLLDRLLLLLIGLEVLQNITAYLKDQSIHTEMVLLTALTAVARKVIVMPPGHDKDPMLLLGVGAVIVCLAAAYFLLRANRPSP